MSSRYSIPENVRLLTVQPVREQALLLGRLLEHTFQLGTHASTCHPSRGPLPSTCKSSPSRPTAIFTPLIKRIAVYARPVRAAGSLRQTHWRAYPPQAP